MLSACAYPAAHLVDAVAAEKEYCAILVVTPGNTVFYKWQKQMKQECSMCLYQLDCK
ncbi:hypothetical protein T06_10753 [Trichinella sp. T6]|nr:hypothetical protein T06_14224 [Trichinella sp. T6]KRX60326.1 hypothetical protein T06_10753 [Trichinella sp. T6]